MVKLSVLIVPLFLFSILACNNPAADNQHAQQVTVPKDTLQPDFDISGKFSDQKNLQFDSTAIGTFFSKYLLLKPFQKEVETFYEKRSYAFAWYDDRGLIEPAGNFYARLQNLPAEGITAVVPYLSNLDSLLATRDTLDKSMQTETEVLFSAIYFFFARKVWSGIDEPLAATMEWYLPRKKISYEKWLDSLLAKPDGFSHAKDPVYRQYNLLKSFLQKYRAIEKSGKWGSIVPEKKMYSQNDSSSVIRQVKMKLYQTGDLTGADSTGVFDTTLQLAVKKFQRRHGTGQSGVIDAAMIKILNEPMHSSIEKILVNMERSRWLPMATNGEYISVNIPEFKLHLYRGDTLYWSMNVVVGKAVNKTVIFSGYLKQVVFSPYWYVPASIYKSEVLPGIRKNRNYLASHHMERYGNGVRQLPGVWNSLGQVKFLFPNSYSIYFHDTPAKSLFSETRRDFSHGCIRLAEPKKLAAYLLKDDSAWNDNAITAAMKAGKEKYVTLSKPVPVFITYFTAWVDRQGQLNIRDDIYMRDKRLASMLMDTR